MGSDQPAGGRSGATDTSPPIAGSRSPGERSEEIPDISAQLPNLTVTSGTSTGGPGSFRELSLRARATGSRSSPKGTFLSISRASSERLATGSDATGGSDAAADPSSSPGTPISGSGSGGGESSVTSSSSSSSPSASAASAARAASRACSARYSSSARNNARSASLLYRFHNPASVGSAISNARWTQP